jgi:hypothetical protein
LRFPFGCGFGRGRRRTDEVLAASAAMPSSPATLAPTGGQVKVTYLGTTMLLVDDGMTKILIDAFLTAISLIDLLLNKRCSTDRALVDATLDRIGAHHVDAIFISHSHYDHAFDAGFITERTDAHLYGSVSTLNIGRGFGLREHQMSLYVVNKPLTIGDFKVTVLKSKHSPGTVGGDDTPIAEPLPQPARPRDYFEGGSHDFFIQHGNDAMLMKSSANFIPGALDNIRAHALFIATALLGRQNDAFKNRFYDETVDKVHPGLVVPTHWNNFCAPLSPDLQESLRIFDDVPAGFGFMTRRLSADGIRFEILQGFGSVMLFGS